MQVDRVRFEVVHERFASEVQREAHVANLRPTRNTHWFCVGDKGFAGLIQVKPGVWRLKSAFVRPRHRGSGVGLALTDAREEFAIDVLGARELHVISRFRVFWLGRGYQVMKLNRPGVWTLRKRV